MKTLLFQLRAELWKLFARKRSYMGFVAFALLQVALWLVIKLMKGEDALKRQVALQGEAVETYISAPTFALLIMNLSLFLLGGLYLALVSGIVGPESGEIDAILLLLSRSNSCFRLLGLLFFSCSVFPIVLVAVPAVAAFVFSSLVHVLAVVLCICNYFLLSLCVIHIFFF